MDKKTIDTYNLCAKEYDEETRDFWKKFPTEFIDSFSNFVGTNLVLNVGSGPGRDGLLLQEKGIEVMCLDASSEMVQLSTERGLTSVVGDFNNLPFEDECFTGVWAYTSLLHIPKSEIDTALKEIYRVLKPGGVFALGLIEGETESYRESSGVGQPRWFSYYTREEVERLLNTHGFELNSFEAIKPRTKVYMHFLSRKN